MKDQRKKPRPRPTTIAIAKKLRKDATFPERLLWSRLRRRQVHGRRFRRQHPIGRYVVDFCCTDARLIVEVDGDSHIGRRSADTVRQRALEQAGYRVLRISNDDILHNIDTVVDAIAHTVLKAAGDRHPPPAPSLQGGELRQSPKHFHHAAYH